MGEFGFILGVASKDTSYGPDIPAVLFGYKIYGESYRNEEWVRNALRETGKDLMFFSQ